MSQPRLSFLALTSVVLLLVGCKLARRPVLSAEEVASEARRGVVVLRVTSADGVKIGTGFAVRPGIIATNAHVVAGYRRIAAEDEAGHPVSIAGVDKVDVEHDLALLRAPAMRLLPLRLAVDSGPPQGSRVYAFGHPEDLEFTLSDGLVSSVRELDGTRTIQMTAAISPGSSGGPVLNERGEVVGVSTFYLGIGQNLNFAIHAQHLRDLLSPKRASDTIQVARLSDAERFSIRFLDVGGGVATFVKSGTSNVLIDGGADPDQLGRVLDRLSLNGRTIDVVMLTRLRHDHYGGLKEIFASKRHIRLRYYFEAKDTSSSESLRELRDSVLSRVDNAGLIFRDADDPCANGSSICSITMQGGAVIRLMRPNPAGQTPDDRVEPVKVISPDNSLSIWIGANSTWLPFAQAMRYDADPGFESDVLRAEGSGFCLGMSESLLDAVRPSIVIAPYHADGVRGVLTPSEYGDIVVRENGPEIDGNAAPGDTQRYTLTADRSIRVGAATKPSLKIACLDQR